MRFAECKQCGQANLQNGDNNVADDAADGNGHTERRENIGRLTMPLKRRVPALTTPFLVSVERNGVFVETYAMGWHWQAQ